MTSADVDRLFQEAGAAGIRVLSMADVFSDPHYTERETFVDVEDPELGEVSVPAPVPRHGPHAGPDRASRAAARP